MKATQREGNIQSKSLTDSKYDHWLLVIGIVLIAAALRAPFTSVGPLIKMIQEDLGLSNTVAGAITTLPLLAFAILSPFAPKLARRFGLNNVLLMALVMLAIGILIRSSSGTGLLFTGTAILGLSIAVCNVLMPGLIKGKFPQKVGLMTGVYSVSMNLCAAAASGISVPLASNAGFGWKGTLAIWFIIAALAALFWIPQLRKQEQSIPAKSSTSTGSMWKAPLAWKVTIFMGLQSLLYYVFIAWFAVLLGERGMTSSHAGWILSLMQLAQLPFTFFVPLWAAKMKNQRVLVMITVVLYFIGISGIWLGNSALMVVWAICFGIAGGFAFSLAMMFFSLRTRSTQEAAELSGMAQSVGYALAALGPALFGLLHDVTNSWTIPLMLLLGASVGLLIVGLGAASDRYVGDRR
jgi:CP family cyanate transporter-like MFS transporter